MIRPLVSTDQDDWLRLWQGYCDFYRSAVAPEVSALTWRRIIDKDFPFLGLGAEDGEGRLAGFAVCVFHPGTWNADDLCYLEDLFVDPRARGRGHGKALIAAVFAEARERGSARVYWKTKADNAAARSLYATFAAPGDWVVYEADA